MALLLAFSGLGIGAGFAGEKVWVGLYMAENGPPPPNAVLAPESLHRSLREVFGFKHYELIKAQEIELRNEWEQWFVPRRDFFIRLEPLRRQPGQPRFINYEIYKDGFIVAKGQYEPWDGMPLFINGPDFHQGRLIFVLDAR
ncbi:MAG TPA: hypothetical protein VGZ93_09425 [Candidatus Methylacidiphilales bacterium]|nr:hypothetical protein [Candidatus Methylacidiphilales bacterium]